MGKEYTYFTNKEVKGLDERFIHWLEVARCLADVPFVITSGKRTKKKNEGAKNSAHFRGLAVDIRCSTSTKRWKILDALFEVKFRRIGIYDRHIHVDADPSLPQRVVWTGISK